MPASPDLTGAIAAEIVTAGPITVERFMGLANAHYYASRDPFGVKGDFVTAPEISQMFGELIGLALADLSRRAGAANPAFVELGPGRGTLAVDALRAMAKAGLAPGVHLVETSPLLRARQRERLPDAIWHETIATLPIDRPLLIVANEFFDALPIRQYVSTVAGWRERLVAHGPDGFSVVPGPADEEEAIPPHLRNAEPGAIVEANATAYALARALGERLERQGGAILVIDYGHGGGHPGDTLQAVRAHAYADPFARPGDSDLTAHVDFAALGAALTAGGARVLGPVDQGQWLVTSGIAHRAATLARASPHRESEITTAYRRLTHPEEMGTLFKVLGATAPGWPAPAGFG